MSPVFNRFLSSRTPRSLLAAACLVVLSPLALAQSVEIKDAWVRATVPGQKATGAYMTLSAEKGATLKALSSPVAGVAEVHEMRMDGNVMKMSALKDGLNLPAGQKVELKPGSYHLMLMDLKGPVLKDTQIPITLVFVDSKGVESKTEVRVPVKTAAPMASMHSGH